MQSTQTTELLFYSLDSAFFSLLLFDFDSKNGNALKATQSQPMKMPYACAPLWSSSSVLCFSDLFNSVQTTTATAKKEWKTDAETTKIMHAKLLSTSKNVYVLWVCVSVAVSTVCAKVQVHALAAFAAWLQTIYIYIFASNILTARERNQFFLWVCKPFSQVQRT